MTEDKSLKDRAIDIKWKKYVLVSDRVLYFNENYPNGIDMKQMGPTIGKVKAAFGRADGRMISEVVKQFVSK